MDQADSFVFGISLLLIGSAFIILLLISLRFNSLRRSKKSAAPLMLPTEEHQDAVLTIEAGGRITAINQKARQLFDSWEEQPNLENLAHRVKPAEAFLTLCANQGRAEFVLNGQAVEGASYFIKQDHANRTIIALRKIKWELSPSSEPLSGDAQPSITAQSSWSRIYRLIQTIHSNLDLEEALKASLEAAESVLQSDYAEITIWDTSTNALIPYRLLGTPGLERKLEATANRYTAEVGYSGYLATQRSPLLILDVDNAAIQPALDRSHYPFRSFIGAPMLTSEGEFIGTIELASLEVKKYQEKDIPVLEAIANQASIAIRNALQYHNEKQFAHKTERLADLSQSISFISDFPRLIEHLLDGIAAITPVDVLGFLLYDDNRQILVGQKPFLGIQSNVVEWYQVIIMPDSKAEALLNSQEIIHSEDTITDQRMIELGLHHLAQAAGIKETLLIPLVSRGHVLGFLQAGGRKDTLIFGQRETELLASAAQPAAQMIDNALELRKAVRRADITAIFGHLFDLIAKNTATDEIITCVVRDLCQVLKADMAGIFLVDEDRGELRLHRASLHGIPPEFVSHQKPLPLDDPQFSRTITGSHTTIIRRELAITEDPEHNAKLEMIIPMYRQIIDQLNIRSSIAVPLIVDEIAIGEMLIGSLHPNFFGREDLEIVTTTATQLSNAVDLSLHFTQTDISLQKRLDQLTALTHISRELNSTLDLEQLMEMVYDEILQTTHSDCGTILLFELTGINRRIKPNIMFSLGDSPSELLNPLVEKVLMDGEPLLIDDFDQVDASQAGSIAPPHDGIRSALIVPIAYQGRVVGLIQLHSSNPSHYDNASQDIAEVLATQAAIALGNAHRYQEQVQRTMILSQRADTLAKLLEASQLNEAEQPLEQFLEAIARAIQATTTFDGVLVSVFDEHTQQMRRITGSGITPEIMQELKAHPQPWADVQKILKPEFRLGKIYFIPYEKSPIIPTSLHTVALFTQSGRQQAETIAPEHRWHPDDLLLLPLFSRHGQPLGLISVDAPRDGLRPDGTTLETLEIIANQAALSIEATLGSEDKRADIVQRADQLSAILDIAEAVHHPTNRAEVLQILGESILTKLAFDVVLIGEFVQGRPILAQMYGAIPEGVTPKILFGQRNPLRQSLLSNATYLVTNLNDEPEWQNAPLLRSLNTKGFICLPFGSAVESSKSQNGDRAIHPQAALLAVSHKSLPPLRPEDRELYLLLSRQIGIVLQNVNLLRETQHRLQEVNLLMDFSRQLGSLDPTDILRSLTDSAIRAVPATDTAMVALWEPRKNLLIPQYVVGFAKDQKLMEMSFAIGEALPGQVFASGKSLLVDEVDFARDYNLSPANLMLYRDATAGQPPISCLIEPIIGVTQAAPLGVLVLDNTTTPAAFTSNDQALISSLAQQTALTLENARLYQAAEQRSLQLQALTNAATALTTSLEPDELIASLLDQLQTVLPFDTGTLWLRKDSQLVVRAARGFTDTDQRIGLSVDIKDSQLLNRMLSTNQPLSIPDTKSDPLFMSLIAENSGFILPYRSWLGVPLILANEPIGVIALEKIEANFFTPDHIRIATTIASQASIGLENANLYQQSVQHGHELDQRSTRLAILNRLSSELSMSLNTTQILGHACKELFQAIQSSARDGNSGLSAVTAILVDETGRASLEAEYPSTDEFSRIDLPPNPLFDRISQTLGSFSAHDIHQEPELAPLHDLLTHYNTQSLLAIPIASGNILYGLLMVHINFTRFFDTDEVELARTIGNQVSIAVQNSRLFAETRSLTNDLEQRVLERTAELEKEHQRAETLLSITTELSSSLDLEQVLERTLTMLSNVVDAEQSTVLIARPGQKTLHRIASVGRSFMPPTKQSPTPFIFGQGLAGWIISHCQPVLIDDIEQDPRWVPLPDIHTIHRSAIGAPLVSGSDALGCMLMYHSQTSHFNHEQMELVQAAANQVAAAVNNAELYRLIREQAENLGSVLRIQQIETSRSKAILEAVADGVLVTDANMQITLFNASAEKNLDLDRSLVLGKSLEFFTGLFGLAAKRWMETITTWSENPTRYMPGETYAGQITLENGRVLSVHLAPVIRSEVYPLKNEFLGTVSVFRDITHQVEVDRLKSEFVATVSHELRTPMTSIKGYVDILLMGAAGVLTPQQTRFLDIVKTNTERLAVLVNDLLDISRIESGLVKLTFQPINLVFIAEEILDVFARRISEENKPITLERDIEPNLPRVWGDMDRVKQILDVLLENAYLYNTPDGKILLRMQRQNNYIQVDIKDSGVGIPLEDQSHVFERFYRGETPLILGVAGTGLGLAIAQNLVEMHQGQIWLESAGIPGDGTTFSFTLPIYTGKENRPEIEPVVQDTVG